MSVANLQQEGCSSTLMSQNQGRLKNKLQIRPGQQIWFCSFAPCTSRTNQHKTQRRSWTN